MCIRDSCKDTEGGILHIDAMGSVVVKIPSHSSAPIFLYSSVMSSKLVPAFDFLTNIQPTGSVASLSIFQVTYREATQVQLSYHDML